VKFRGASHDDQPSIRRRRRRRRRYPRPAASREADHRAIIRGVLAAEDFYEQANARGQKVPRAGSNMASTDGTVGSSWA
jgi:hypothetical protein